MLRRNAAPRTATRLVVWCAVLTAFGPLPVPDVAAGCPTEASVLSRVEALHVERASRTVRFEAPVPVELYEKAAKKIGTPAVAWSGKKGYGVLVAEQSVERIWMAISDEEHHDLDGYLPVKHSEVLSREEDGQTRTIFQYFQQMGIGRWWVSRVEVNGELFESSGGSLWEVRWQDEMQTVDADAAPMNAISSKLTAIRASKGAWLLVRLTEDCTLIEHFSWSDPGGFAGVAQPLVAKKALRNTVLGILKLADEHVNTPHPGELFLQPDGKPIE